nr:hypothetical protein [Rickettsia monacensis]
MNKHYILDEALKLNLPKKILPVPHKITLPKINLATEMKRMKKSYLPMSGKYF